MSDILMRLGAAATVAASLIVDAFGSLFSRFHWLSLSSAMVGTLYVPQAQERLTVGIDRASTQRMRTVKGLGIEPFKDAAIVLRRHERRFPALFSKARRRFDAQA